MLQRIAPVAFLPLCSSFSFFALFEAMAAVICASPLAIQAPRANKASLSKPADGQKFLATRRSVRPERRNSAVVPKASMEVAQVAVDTGLIFGSGAVMVGITLVGLAFGFILLRVESLAEEGKI